MILQENIFLRTIINAKCWPFFIQRWDMVIRYGRSGDARFLQNRNYKKKKLKYSSSASQAKTVYWDVVQWENTNKY